MKLNDLDSKKHVTATKALAEQYEMNFNVEGLSMTATRTMLQKVRGLIKESRDTNSFYTDTSNSSYMKLVFMEQALASHYDEIRSRPLPKIVFENEEVEKSQVVLAAQDVVDSIQKMQEEVGEILLKELPALVASIESEIGSNESQQYNQEVTQSLDALAATLKEAFDGVRNALNGITGQGSGFAGGAEEAGVDMGADLGAEAGADMGAELGADMGSDMGAEEMAPEEEPELGNNVGRAKR